MLLYHSFPRRQISHVNALTQLRIMLEHGLLMTPECIEIPESPRAETLSIEKPKTKFRQIRACFTLAQRGELWTPIPRDREGVDVRSHSDIFGRFAIGLDPIEARELGAMPVIYFYRGLSISNVSMEILYNLRELRSIAIAIARIEARSKNADHVVEEYVLDRLGYTLEGDPHVKEAD